MYFFGKIFPLILITQNQAVGFTDGPPPTPHKAKFDADALSKIGKDALIEFLKQQNMLEFSND